jgi:hypothetical protein
VKYPVSKREDTSCLCTGSEPLFLSTGGSRRFRLPLPESASIFQSKAYYLHSLSLSNRSKIQRMFYLGLVHTTRPICCIMTTRAGKAQHYAGMLCRCGRTARKCNCLGACWDPGLTSITTSDEHIREGLLLLLLYQDVCGNT